MASWLRQKGVHSAQVVPVSRIDWLLTSWGFGWRRVLDRVDALVKQINLVVSQTEQCASNDLNSKNERMQHRNGITSTAKDSTTKDSTSNGVVLATMHQAVATRAAHGVSAPEGPRARRRHSR